MTIVHQFGKGDRAMCGSEMERRTGERVTCDECLRLLSDAQSRPFEELRLFVEDLKAEVGRLQDKARTEAHLRQDLEQRIAKQREMLTVLDARNKREDGGAGKCTEPRDPKLPRVPRKLRDVFARLLQEKGRIVLERTTDDRFIRDTIVVGHVKQHQVMRETAVVDQARSHVDQVAARLEEAIRSMADSTLK